jgi:uracil-DNA glycosylase
MNVHINETWKKALEQEFSTLYFQEIVYFLKTEKDAGKIIYPPGSQIFNAFNFTSFDDVRVVILGQDPYHGPKQAHGLSFSVPEGIKPPPSLANIFKELQSDVGLQIPDNYGDLTAWARQGVLLLNGALTVREGEPFSHAKFGWAKFTDAVIEKISDEKENIIFILWGKFAQDKKGLIDEGKHFILQAAHPSPFSAHKGFFGCKHFSLTNEILVKIGKQPIDWNIKTN